MIAVEDRFYVAGCVAGVLVRLRNGDRFGPYAVLNYERDSLVACNLAYGNAESWLLEHRPDADLSSRGWLCEAEVWADDVGWECCG